MDEHQVKKQTETGYQIFKWQAPFIFSVERFGKDLRYPSLKSKLQARKKEIGLIEAEEIEEFEQEKLEPFPEKKGCIPVKEDDIHKSVLLLKDCIERRN